MPLVPTHSRLHGEYEHLPKFILPLVIFLGLALRLPGINYSFFGDELFSVFRDANELFTTSEDRFRPVFFSLLYLWKQLGFHNEIGLRLLPLIFGVAQIPAAYLVGRKLHGPRLGLTFSVLIAASPLLIEFSQELRMYSLVPLLSLLQTYVLLLLIKKGSESPRSSSTVQWILFVALGLLGVYTHMHYWLFLAGMALTCFRERVALGLWKASLAFGIMICLYLPNIPNVMRFQEVRNSGYFVDIASSIPKLLAGFSVGFNYFKVHDQSLGRPISSGDIYGNIVFLIIALIPAVVILWRLVGMHRERRHTKLILLCHELFTVPAFLAFVATCITSKYFLHPKYLIFSAPFALLFFAYAFITMNYAALRRAIIAFGVAIATIALIHFNDPQNYGRRENWKRAAEYLMSETSPQAPLLLLDGYAGMLRYYNPSATQYVISVDAPGNVSQISLWKDRLNEQLKGKTDAYYLRLDVRQMSDDPKDLLLAAMDQLGVRMGVIQLNPRLKLLHWKLYSNSILQNSFSTNQVSN